ncbi:MAG: tRNA (N6-isopentenyl adenosine(37)-C2)-methylthiotransferase MiaB [Eubacterium sp.]
MFDYQQIDSIDVTVEAPTEEPLRQYYFMKKCKAWAAEEEKRLGRKLTLSMQTMGCQMNARDSEKLEAILSYIGYETVEEPVADFVLYNTCTVRENANLKVYGRLGYMKNQKKKNPAMKIAMCGCMMQEPTVVEKIQKSYPFVDLVFGTHNVYKLAELLYTRIKSDRMVLDIWKEAESIVEDLPSVRKYPFKAGVNIMYGCNNFCTYCIVPYVRGRERSRKPEEILREIKNLIADGVIEIMLLGQNVNSYGKTLEEPMTFAELLQEVEKIEGLQRIRFMTSHPKDLSEELIEVMSKSKKICTHLHLPLQSGSTEILKKMNRRYTKEQYLDLVRKIKDKVPNIALTTDLIVGFPGETEEDFEETLDVVRKVRYDSVYSFIYSKRTGTPAATMEDQVPEDVVKKRFARLLDVIHEISTEITDDQEGEIVEALMEEVNDHDETLITGRLSSNAVVHCPGGKEMIGKICKVRLTESKGFYFMGEIVK